MATYMTTDQLKDEFSFADPGYKYEIITTPDAKDVFKIIDEFKQNGWEFVGVINAIANPDKLFRIILKKIAADSPN